MLSGGGETDHVFWGCVKGDSSLNLPPLSMSMLHNDLYRSQHVAWTNELQTSQFSFSYTPRSIYSYTEAALRLSFEPNRCTVSSFKYIHCIPTDRSDWSASQDLARFNKIATGRISSGRRVDAADGDLLSSTALCPHVRLAKTSWWLRPACVGEWGNCASRCVIQSKDIVLCSVPNRHNLSHLVK